MIICGSISGFKKEDVEELGFPLEGIQLCMDGDLVLVDEEFDIMNNTDVFLEISGAEYYMKGNVLEFKAKCESMMLDGNETDIEINGDLAYAIVRNSYMTEIILAGDHVDFSDPMERLKLNKMKVLGSLWIGIGIGSVHKRCNKVKFY